VVVTRKPVIIPDIRANTPLAAAFRADVIHDLGAVPDYAGSWMGVPLIFREQVIGLLTVVGAEVDAYTARDAELALAFAAQAAVAIVNARLYEQAQGTAALEERQRLARELHDSVSQALFGIGLGARTARTLLDENPADAAAPLDYVLSLAEAGLTEMRALIFELRPEALEQEGLVAALEKQAANLRARHGITVEADLGDPGKSSLAVEEAIYRIAQEALNNTAKHARATTVRLRLAREAGRLVAEIADDGSGFDPAASYSGHLGLRTMRERGERLGGSLSIESVPGTGTRLRVTIPV
jgi:signal transduction histidine kinase